MNAWRTLRRTAWLGIAAAGMAAASGCASDDPYPAHPAGYSSYGYYADDPFYPYPYSGYWYGDPGHRNGWRDDDRRGRGDFDRGDGRRGIRARDGGEAHAAAAAAGPGRVNPAAGRPGVQEHFGAARPGGNLTAHGAR